MESNFVDFAWFPTAKRLSSKASSIVLSVFTDLSIPIPFVDFARLLKLDLVFFLTGLVGAA